MHHQRMLVAAGLALSPASIVPIEQEMPFAVSVKDRMMYSHTFVFDDGKPFTTGCTSVTTVTIEGETLGPYDILIDICVAQRRRKEAGAAYEHKN